MLLFPVGVSTLIIIVPYAFIDRGPLPDMTVDPSEPRSLMKRCFMVLLAM